MAADYDLLVIGGGINGTGIARDAIGRGASVLLAEMGDLAGATSSASTKLIHGGLRYLEYYEFDLVRKALKEREADDIIVIGGGVIPQKDYDYLKEAGVKAIFGPGTNIPDAAQDILHLIREARA